MVNCCHFMQTFYTASVCAYSVLPSKVDYGRFQDFLTKLVVVYISWLLCPFLLDKNALSWKHGFTFICVIPQGSRSYHSVKVKPQGQGQTTGSRSYHRVTVILPVPPLLVWENKRPAASHKSSEGDKSWDPSRIRKFFHVICYIEDIEESEMHLALTSQ